MKRYQITYVQEVTQTVDAECTDDAGVFAKRYAAKNRLVVLQVIAERLVDAPPAAA
jgi:hypothetical protein